jgi:ABC-type transporter Mla subunit MlaD
MRRIATILAVLAAGGAGLAASAGADDAHEYRVEMYNAFGIVEGSDVRVAGVNSGQVTDLEINEAKRAVVTVELSGDLAELGDKTRCSTEPQSLIAEYFISCDPKGSPMPDGGTVPAERVSQTVQSDLVQNTLREPYKRRLQLLINEFGTALAGNPENLNEAIRLGAPALTETRKVTKILADQNRIIRDLNVDSDAVIGELAAARQDVVEFVDEAEDTAAASAARREDLSRDFELLDDFLAELNPTLAELESVARQQTPLLTDLQAAAPGLNRLAQNLPGFNAATETSLASLGEAAIVGRTALKRGADEVALLADAGKKAPVTAEALADFVSDIDDPRRAVEIDERAGTDTGRTSPLPERKDTMGYTGFESLLNWLYYLVGTSSQFDQVAHTMHIELNSFETGPCGHVSSGHDHNSGEPGVPTNDGGTTTNILEAADCVQWLGPNQPGINEDIGLPPYDPAVCPNGTEPAAAEALCDPNQTTSSPARGGGRRNGTRGGAGDGGGSGERAPSIAPPPTNVPDDVLDEILDVPQSALDDLPGRLQNGLRDLGSGIQRGLGRGGGGTSGGASSATGDLLDFLFSN